MATKKITELTELAVASDEDLIPIVDVSDGETKKIQAKRVGAGGIAGDTVPIGTIMPYSGSEEPVNWIVCDGRELNRFEYEDLFTIIGTTYGEGDGSTTFNIPNLKGKIPVGFDSEDGDFNAVGKTGGEKTHTLTIEEMPKHRHGIRTSAGSGGQVDNMPWGAAPATQTTNTEYTGGNGAHNNMQPYLVQKYIIKAFQSVGIVANISNVKSESTVDTYSCNYINGQTLYQDVTGTSSTITFEDNVENYSYIEVYGWANDTSIYNKLPIKLKNTCTLQTSGSAFEYHADVKLEGKTLTFVYNRRIAFKDGTKEDGNYVKIYLIKGTK